MSNRITTTPHTKRTARGVVTADQADHERRHVATQRLRWGDGWIEPGEEVPSGELGRNYGALVRRGVIAPFVPLPEAKTGKSPRRRTAKPSGR